MNDAKKQADKTQQEIFDILFRYPSTVMEVLSKCEPDPPHSEISKDKHNGNKQE